MKKNKSINEKISQKKLEPDNKKKKKNEWEAGPVERKERNEQ